MAEPGTLYAFAHQFYWDFRRLSEGTYRSKLDQKEHARLLAEAENISLSKEQKAHAVKYVREEIRAGRLKKEQWKKRLAEVEKIQLHATRELAGHQAAKKATKKLRVPGERDLVDELLEAQIPDDVLRICADASVKINFNNQQGQVTSISVPNWPIGMASVLPMYLTQHAASFIAAKKDRLFPRSGRPTTRLKQLWFLSRALAGAALKVEPRTAINLVGSKRPEESFQESRAAKPIRARKGKGRG